MEDLYKNAHFRGGQRAIILRFNSIEDSLIPPLFFFSLSEWIPSKVNVDQIFRCIEICVEAACKEPVTQVHGCIVLFDLESLCLGHFMQISPMFAAALSYWVQDCLPMRIKEIHMVFNSRIFNMIFNIFKPFLNVKIRNRVS